jgi:hypothetical protein
MVDYTIYPFKSSGVAPAFAFVESEDDSSAVVEAMNLLRSHASATRVTLSATTGPSSGASPAPAPLGWLLERTA